MQQYIFQNGLLIVIEVYGLKMQGPQLHPLVASIGMGGVIMYKTRFILMGQSVLLSVEMDALSWTSETVLKQELFMLT